MCAHKLSTKEDQEKRLYKHLGHKITFSKISINVKEIFKFCE